MKFKVKYIKLILTTVSFICISIYATYTYQWLYYSIGRSGIDANIRVFLNTLPKIPKNKALINSEFSKFSNGSYQNAEFKFSINEDTDKCYNIDDICVLAISVTERKGKHEVYVVGLNNAQVHQVESMVPSNFWGWLKDN